jgi:hypothetical protein
MLLAGGGQRARKEIAMSSSTRKKVSYLLAFIFLVSCIFTACGEQGQGSAGGQASNKEPAAKASVVKTSGEPAHPSYEESGNFLDALWNLPVKLAGKEYSMPIAVKDLISDGWKLPEDSNEVDISYRKGIYTNMTKDEVNIELRFENISKKDAELKAKDCHVLYLSWEQADNAALPDIGFTKDISLASTVSEVKAAYGEPTASFLRDRYDESQGMIYQYGGQNQHLTFYAKGETLTGFELKVVHIEDFSKIDGKDVDVKALNYEAPQTASDNLADGVVTVDGKLLKLPCPVAELLQDGWILCPPSDSLEAGDGSSDVLAYKGHKAINLFLKNYGDKEMALENTSIKAIMTISSEPELLVFPDGLKLGTVLEELDESGYYTDNYLYHARLDDDGKVIYLEATYQD